ncbi:MAG: hypothetical protein FWG78_01360 [Coriobacteriia bacterium]|nr:hypothetical protein [Coriobacteriia bacterium]
MYGLNDLIMFLNRLEEEKFYYRLTKIRDSIMVIVSVPGQKWEIEFMPDGSIEIEKYCSNGEIFDEREIDVLFKEF